MPKTDFPGFLRKVKPEITLVEGLLRQPLSEEPEGLIADLLKIEVWYARIQTILAFAEGYLDLAEREKLPTKETRTELDREKELASRVAASGWAPASLVKSADHFAASEAGNLKSS